MTPTLTSHLTEMLTGLLTVKKEGEKCKRYILETYQVLLKYQDLRST